MRSNTTGIILLTGDRKTEYSMNELYGGERILTTAPTIMQEIKR
jgi:hypothetical protein